MDMLEKILKDEELTQVSGGGKEYGPIFNYKIKEGDTLYAIAQKYGTTVEILQRLNGIPNPDKLLIGITIVIPYNG